MHLLGHYFDTDWTWIERAQGKARDRQDDVASGHSNDNSADRVIGEIGLVLLVPLAGAAVVGLVLNALGIV